MRETLGREIGAAVSNPLHTISGPGTRWTRVNFAEAVQGVQKPLDWGFWEQGLEYSLRATFFEMGALSRRELPLPAIPEERFSGVFFGRVAGNVDMFRRVADRLPGSSGDQLEEKMFGKPVPAQHSRKAPAAIARYPVVAVKMPRALIRPAYALPRMLAANRAWWKRDVLDAPPGSLEDARALLRDACSRFSRVLAAHGMPTMLSGQLLDALARLAELATGDPGLGLTLATGLGSMDEIRLITDVYRAAHGEIAIEELIREHGNHGPEEGKLSSTSWREDHAHLDGFLRSYRGSTAADPRERERMQMARREQAQARVSAGLPAHRQLTLRLTTAMARRYIPLREVGKAAFLVAIDGGRCAARVIGACLADRGEIDEPEDVFFLTIPEALGEGGRDLVVAVSERKEADERYRALEIPVEWTGVPIPIVSAGEAQGGRVARVRGLGVFGEEPVRGRARVVSDPATAELRDGEILVCATTDPSWTPLFMVAAAVVIDTGGPISHGAIVARELGVPCVINTKTGTRVITDGAELVVDGARGLVEIVDTDTAS